MTLWLVDEAGVTAIVFLSAQGGNGACILAGAHNSSACPKPITISLPAQQTLERANPDDLIPAASTASSLSTPRLKQLQEKCERLGIASDKEP